MTTPVLENEVTLMGKTFNVYGTVEESNKISELKEMLEQLI